MTYDPDMLLETCASLLDMLARNGLITIVDTMESTKVDTALATILSAMEQIRGRRATVAAELHKLDNALAGLERLAGQLTDESEGAAPPTSDAVIASPSRAPEPPTVEGVSQDEADANTDKLETAVEAQAETEHSADATEAQVEILAVEPVRSRRAAPRQAPPNTVPVYYICERCFGFHNRGTPCSSALSYEDLDGRHGVHGWISREQPVITMDDIRRQAMLMRIEEGRAAQAAETESTLEVRSGKPIGLRPGSKNSRIYEATKGLLEVKSPLHLDEILAGVQGKEQNIFDNVGDARMNLSNILSLLKSRRLLASDHRGYWWLPNGRAAH
jgi:hypothetical protein